MNFNIFKEPKGLLKVIEVVLAIIAFASVCSYSNTLTFVQVCDSQTPTPKPTIPTTPTTPTPHTNTTTTPTTTTTKKTVKINDKFDFPNVIAHPLLPPREKPRKEVTYKIPIKYPFKLAKASPSQKPCNSTVALHVKLTDSVSSKAIFFVFVAVVSFLITLLLLPVYMLHEDYFGNIEWIPSADFILHAALLFFWFCASVTWAVGISQLEDATKSTTVFDLNAKSFNCKPHDVIQTLPNATEIENSNRNVLFDIDEDFNKIIEELAIEKNYECKITSPTSYSGPVAGVVFGFFTLIVFGVNVLFSFREVYVNA